MKASVISGDFHARYIENPADPNAFEGVAVVFDGTEDYHGRIDDPTLEFDENTILVIRGVGPIGYPGSAEVENMRPPDYLLHAPDAELERRRETLEQVGGYPYPRSDTLAGNPARPSSTSSRKAWS